MIQTGFKMRSVGITYTEPTALAAEVQDFVTESFRTILPTAVQVLGVDVVDLVSLMGSSTSPANEMGTVGTSSIAPTFTAVTATLKGPLRARYGQGRMYLPMLNEEWTNWEVLNATGIAAIQGMITEMTNRYVGNDVTGFNLVNAHGIIPAKAATPTRPARDAVPASWYDVDSIRLNTNVTFLRSRKAGVGS